MDEAQEIARISAASGFSEDAVRSMAEALRAGNGTMAQFNHFELGGFGQWSAGGMLMIGDMFNNSLKARVGMLADMISSSLSEGALPTRSKPSNGFGASSQWWPEDLGHPSSSGAQNGVRYAVFPGPSRLAIETGGKVTVYDTGDHRIGGVSQQQGGSNSLRFSSQLGTIDASDLRVVDAKPVSDTDYETTANAELAATSSATSSHWQTQTQGPAGVEFIPSDLSSAPDVRNNASKNLEAEEASRQGAVAQTLPFQASAFQPSDSATSSSPAGDPLTLLRGLAELKKEGIVTEEEFAAKKAELLARM